MATISKTGIATGQNITADHTLNIIEALDGTDTTDINIKGTLTLPDISDVSASLATALASSGTGFTAAGISGSLGTNATLIRSLTAAGISGSLGTNATLIRSLTAATITGSFNVASSSFSTRVTNVETNNVSFPFTGSAIISGSLRVIGKVQADDTYSNDNIYIVTDASNPNLGDDSAGAGNNNIGIGNQVLENKDTVDNNIAIGQGALKALSGSGADNNIGIGKSAGQLLVKSNNGGETPSDNIIIGNQSSLNFKYGIQNQIIGGQNLTGVYSSNDGNDINYITAIGYQAGEKLRSGSGDVYIGYRAGRYMGGTSNGTIYAVKQNVMIGLNCGDTKQYGNGNTYVGAEIVKSGDSSYNETILGYAVTGIGSNTVAVGNTSVSSIKGQVSFTTYSDERIKRNITSGSLGLEFISTLNPVRFQKVNPANYPSEILEERYTDRVKYETIDSYPYSSSYVVPADPAPTTDNQWYDGLIAQEVSSSLSNLGIPSDIWNANETNGKQGIKYETLTIPLIKAVQELSASLSTALDRIAILEG
jgi:hypothetical protein